MAGDTHGPLRKGQEIDGYRVLGQIGAGNMGVVYLARQISMDRVVALKVLLPQWVRKSPDFVAQFVREARGAGSLRHPNIIAVHDAGTCIDDGLPLPWFAMEYVDGENLESVLEREGTCPADLLPAVLRGAAAALAYAGSRGLVHRDIKPANLMLTREKQVKLADFGLVMESGAGSERLVGTPRYMSPEQILRRTLDCRTDHYALGATLFHLLTGEPPYIGESSKAVMRAHVYHPVPDPREFADCDPRLAELAMRLMAKEPGQRSDGPQHLVELVEAALRRDEAPKPRAAGPRPSRSRSRSAAARARQAAGARRAVRVRPAPAKPAAPASPAKPAAESYRRRPSVEVPARPAAGPARRHVSGEAATYGSQRRPSSAEIPAEGYRRKPSSVEIPARPPSPRTVEAEAESDRIAEELLADDEAEAAARPALGWRLLAPLRAARALLARTASLVEDLGGPLLRGMWRVGLWLTDRLIAMLPVIRAVVWWSIPRLARIYAVPAALTWRVKVVAGSHHLLTAQDEGRGLVGALACGRDLPHVWTAVTAEGWQPWRVLGSRVWLREVVSRLAAGLARWDARSAAGRALTLQRALHRIYDHPATGIALAFDRDAPGVCDDDLIALAKVAGAAIVPMTVAAKPAWIFGHDPHRPLIPAPFATIHVAFAKPVPADPDSHGPILKHVVEGEIADVQAWLDAHVGLTAG